VVLVDLALSILSGTNHFILGVIRNFCALTGTANHARSNNKRTPASKSTEGATEVWSYPSGNRFCTVNVTMIDGRVKRMNYVGPTGGQRSQNDECFFAVANCTY
jgi:hypothetical protein